MKKSFRNFRGGRAEGEENRKEKKKREKNDLIIHTLGCNSGEVHSLAWNVVQIKWAHKKP